MARFMEWPADWTRENWLAYRRQGIGGSDCASIAGLSTFGSPTAVYYEKVGLAPDQPENEAMQWGRLLEAPIAAEFTERTGLHVACPQLLVWDEELPHRRATLDGLVVETSVDWGVGCPPPVEHALGTIQIKTTRDHSWVDGIPDRVALQCQHELGVAGLSHCWLAVLHGGQRLDIYELEFDPAVFDGLCKIVDRFWLQNVLAENPPPADSNPATTEALKAVFGDRADGSTVVLDDDLVIEAMNWLHAKQALKRSEQECELRENALRAALGEATFGADHDGVELVSWRPQRKPAPFDRKRFEGDHPDLAAEYTGEPGVTRVLRATKALKALAGEGA